MQEKVKEYFQNNPEEDKVFSTADGFLFKQEMYATAHAATITEKEVTKHTNERGNAAAAIPAVEVPVTTETEKGAEIRTKNETVEAPTIMDAPSEVEGKAEVIADVVTEQAEAVKEVAETAAIPAVEVPVTTETEKGAEVRTKNETVEASTIMDAPSEVEGKAEVIADVVTEQAEAVKEVAEAAPKAVTAPKAKTTAKK